MSEIIEEKKIELEGSSSIGVFASCTEDYVVVYPFVPKSTALKIEKALKVEVIRTTICGSIVVGSMVRGNSNGFVVSRYCESEEIEILKRTEKRVGVIVGKMNACGNIILANDMGAIVHPELSDKDIEKVEKALGVPVERGTIGGLKNVGMAGVATNRGVLVHPRISEKEIEVVERVLNVKVEVGTVNFGSGLVGSGLIANTKGYLAGRDTTGFELGRIESALGFV